MQAISSQRGQFLLSFFRKSSLKFLAVVIITSNDRKVTHAINGEWTLPQYFLIQENKASLNNMEPDLHRLGEHVYLQNRTTTTISL